MLGIRPFAGISLAAFALAAFGGAVHQANAAAISHPMAIGTTGKRTRIGSKEGFADAKRRRNRIRNRIAARSRAANR